MRVHFDPVRLLELELDEGVQVLPPSRRRTEILVRLHGRPLGIVELEPAPGGLSEPELMSKILGELGERIVSEPSLDASVDERRALLERVPFASVVVATRDRPEHLAECLDTLLDLAYPRFEIVVVDNAPQTDATEELIQQRYASRDVRYVREDRPGLASAHNRGIEEAGGELIAFTDDDVLVDPLWLLELASGFEATEKVGCVTGLILPAELETPAQLVLERYSRLGKGFSRKLFDTGEHRPETGLFPYAAGLFGSGANMAFSAEALAAIGGFDPATGTGTRARGGDDLAAFFGVVSAGYTLVYEPGALVRHKHRPAADLERQLFDYGAGLTAYLTKVVVDRPSRVFDIARKAPGGLAHGLGKSSDRNATWHDLVSRKLVRAERRGMLYGPFGYFAARWGRA